MWNIAHAPTTGHHAHVTTSLAHAHYTKSARRARARALTAYLRGTCVEIYNVASASTDRHRCITMTNRIFVFRLSALTLFQLLLPVSGLLCPLPGWGLWGLSYISFCWLRNIARPMEYILFCPCCSDRQWRIGALSTLRNVLSGQRCSEVESHGRHF